MIVVAGLDHVVALAPRELIETIVYLDSRQVLGLIVCSLLVHLYLHWQQPFFDILHFLFSSLN